MNAAILLLATCMSDAPIYSASECATCSEVCSSCGGCGYSFWSWFCGKKKECGHHIHCPHPGPIPGMEHPTLKQRIKDCLCPNRCAVPVSRTCDDGCQTVIIMPATAEPLAEPLKMPKASDDMSRIEKIKTMPSKGTPEVPVKFLDPNERPY